MCKVFMIAGIKKEHLSKVQSLVKEIGKDMSRTESDGIGYAAITDKGKIYGEKWVHVEDAFEQHKTRPVDPVSVWMEGTFDVAAKFEKEPNRQVTYQSYGKLGLKNDTVALILHARSLTVGEKSIENTHPFIITNDRAVPDTALIHNGSIVNHDDLTKTMSSCDSEVILHEYMDNMVYYNSHGIVNVANRLRGEYAVGVLSSIPEGSDSMPILDIFKSNKPLYAAFIIELETMVFSTSDTVLESAAKTVGLTVSSMMKINDGYLIRLNAVTGCRHEDLVSFPLSERWKSSVTNYNHSHHKIPERVVLPAQKEDTKPLASIETLKTSFKEKHAEAFNQKIYEIGPTTKEESDYFDELEKNNKIDFKALRLVNSILNKLA